MRGGRGLRGVVEALRHEKLLAPGAVRLSSLVVGDAGSAAAGVAAVVQSSGVARLPSVLARPTVAALLAYVNEEFARCSQAAADDRQPDWFTSGVYQPQSSSGAKTRWELRLPLSAAIVRTAVLETLFGNKAVVGGALEELAGGPSAELWEVTAIVSEPGSAPQQVHCDEFFTDTPHLYSIFVALQAVTEEMGPTRFLLQTNNRECHDEFYGSSRGRFLQGATSAVAVMDAGDGTLYDGRTLHCGGANRSDVRRTLLNITFCHAESEKGLDKEKFTGCGEADTRSLRNADLPRRLRLGQLHRLNELFEE
eukprot:TRINITY_DN82973_c0_g1_i1.p1 TRINITY_DN82973_c0_g1~~TRINITY_DN82973_c0_g1_i1.p1  ORF type:complete len:309 (-),score=78.40 TRINITY_DN82973_c0_g1_i1:3-929(-)